jgi:acyl-CoA dehydrogenase
MNLTPTARSVALLAEIRRFMDDCVYPGEPRYRQEIADSGDPCFHPPVMEALKAEARRRGLWNLFLADTDLGGVGLSNVEFAPLAEEMGRTIHLAMEATNCSAPDTGNMELLARFGTPDQRKTWLQPLLDGEIRSAFAMTEPLVASADATNMRTRVTRQGDEYVIRGQKWFTSGAASERCKLIILMGVSDADAPRHARHTMLIVPTDAPGIEIVRRPLIFNHDEPRGGHPEIVFHDVRVPVENRLGEEGWGFVLAQARLGPGRIHHCMRLVGMAERGLQLMCRRAISRKTFGRLVSSQGMVQDWIAEARVRIDQVRLLTLQAAWLIDTYGNKAARNDIAAIKVAAPRTATWVLDRAIQVHGAAGVTEDTALAEMWAHCRTLHIADGPDEIHKMAIARAELRRQTMEAWAGRMPMTVPIPS